MGTTPPIPPRLSARWAGAVLSLASLPLSAQQVDGTSPPPSVGGSLLQLTLGFLGVIVLIFASLWLLKRLTTPRRGSGGLMKVVTAISVGPRERVVLLEVGDRWLLVGVGPGHISALGETPRQELPSAGPGAGAPEFSAWLKRALDRRSEPHP